jgi:predicted phage replisome organizer
MPNGKDYLLFYLKILLESIDHEGALRFSDTIPYNEQMLSVITNTNIDIVRSAMKLFSELGMVDVFDDRTIYMSEVQKMIGSETSVAERVRRSRASNSQKALQCNTDVTKSNTEIEKELESEIDTEIEKETKATRKRFSPPSLDDVSAYCKERGNTVDAETFIDFYSGKGWMVGKNKMKDWKACIRTWEKRDSYGSESKPSARKGKTVIEQQYTQREYDAKDYDGLTPEEVEEASKYDA